MVRRTEHLEAPVDTPEQDETWTIKNPEVRSDTNLSFDFGEEGKELRPNEKLTFVIPEGFRDRIVRDVILKHRKPEAYRKDIGPDRYDPYGAYSRVELHDTSRNAWVRWVDPK